jgi:hypothetical protein
MARGPPVIGDTLERVSGYRRQEVVQRAGVDLADVDRLVELGIVTPDAQDRLSRDDVRHPDRASDGRSRGDRLRALSRMS